MDARFTPQANQQGADHGAQESNQNNQSNQSEAHVYRLIESLFEELQERKLTVERLHALVGRYQERFDDFLSP